jgi:uncharacterized protein (TIGR02246 family)
MLARLTRTSVVFPVAAVAILLTMGGCQSSGGGSGNRSGHARDVAASSSGDATREVNAVLDRYTPALINKDTAALEQIWADDLTFVNPRGEVLTRQQRLENIKTGSTAFKSVDLSDRRVRVYGDTAVATMQVALQAQYSGQEGSGKHRVTIVLSRQKGTWRMVVVHMTPIAA